MGFKGLILVLVATAVTLASAEDGSGPNLNGDYLLSQTPGGHSTQTKFPTHFRDYPRGVSFFDVYSPPITTLYSQVFWKGLHPVPLPQEVVARFDGKGMAVVGFEMDQVRMTEEGDVSVPITVAYNHHFESAMVGKHGYFEKVSFDGPDDPRMKQHDMGHGIPSHSEMWVVQDRGTSSGAIPISQSFGGANGGEFRKSFHGYAPGYAQVVDSPTHLQVTPMQIDTWNREQMNISHPTRFVPGPLPRNSAAPTDANYSGLLECPITTRIRKDIDGKYTARVFGTCGTSITTASECFAAANSTFKHGIKLTYDDTSDSSLPHGCSASADARTPGLLHVIFNHAPSEAACGARAVHFAGSAASLVQIRVELDSDLDLATITLTGPSEVWFGVGFNASAMKDAPWAIIVDGSGRVSERRLADQSPGIELAASVTVVSSTSQAGLRSVVLTRPLKGKTPAHLTFSPSSDTLLPLINAVGSSPGLSYHKAKTPTAIALLPTASPSVAGACLCASQPAPFGKAKGSLVYAPTRQPEDKGVGTIGFGNVCAPWPRSDLLDMKNPTCDIRSYVGGQIACHHMFSLLDADQEIPWSDQPIEYQLKFRFWVQEYNASYHRLAQRTTWGIASPVEFDVPKCEVGMQGCKQQVDGSWVHTITGTFTAKPGRLLSAHFHCHAPTCLSVALYRCPKGTAVCNASSGSLLCLEKPVYGGTGQVDEPRFDEPGFILQPPCLWGSPEFGLEEPPEVGGYVLGAIKASNATHSHHGEMAWLQMYYYDSAKASEAKVGVYV